jgi:hypothetical protein
LVVAEFYKRSLVVELLDNGANLPARKPLPGKIRQQRYDIQKGWSFVPALFRVHHSTQQVTSLGTFSPLRMIHIVLTTALLPCRLTVTSRRQ